jgi:fructose-1,6-bisphosphatase II / sedoheptulose-1,7-bisphosphatase
MTNQSSFINLSNIQNQLLSVAEKAAIACQKWVGKGDNHLADLAAVTAMRDQLNLLPINGRIVIGEGERDEAPMLYIGEEVGIVNQANYQNLTAENLTNFLPNIDIALDPLEGTTICADSAPGSLAVIAFSGRGGFLHAPDVYMEKIAVGANLPADVVNLDNSIATNFKNLALAKKCAISDLTATILNRPRHQELIAKVRELGAKVKLITDGDIAAIIAIANSNLQNNSCQNSADIYLGSGGAPEGVLAAAALRVSGGQIFGRLVFSNDNKQAERAKTMGIANLHRQYDVFDMTGGKENSEIMLICSGVTSGEILHGVASSNNRKIVNSLIFNLGTKQISNITNHIYHD